jgi:hypothetical protein
MESQDFSEPEHEGRYGAIYADWTVSFDDSVRSATRAFGPAATATTRLKVEIVLIATVDSQV